MFLQPKKIKFKKTRKGRLKRLEFKTNNLSFGNIGMKSQVSGLISARQIEAARRVIAKKIKRKGKVWVRLFPYLPVTSKPTESRMGKGKGSVEYWAARVAAGSTLFEICGVPQHIAIEALRAGSFKLPVKTKIFD
jgi:large subunit ribosomal protein L16